MPEYNVRDVQKIRTKANGVKWYFLYYLLLLCMPYQIGCFVHIRLMNKRWGHFLNFDTITLLFRPEQNWKSLQLVLTFVPPEADASRQLYIKHVCQMAGAFKWLIVYTWRTLRWGIFVFHCTSNQSDYYCCVDKRTCYIYVCIYLGFECIKTKVMLSEIHGVLRDASIMLTMLSAALIKNIYFLNRNSDSSLITVL